MILSFTGTTAVARLSAADRSPPWLLPLLEDALPGRWICLGKNHADILGLRAG
jgi:hypothetical protein